MILFVKITFSLSLDCGLGLCESSRFHADRFIYSIILCRSHHNQAHACM